MITQRLPRCSGASRRGLTMVEMVGSIVLVGVGLVAALNTVGASKISQFKVSASRQGHLLALQLMTEILEQEYEEPVDTVDFGRESSESGGDRDDWDDVDDYDGWDSTPPEYKDGTAMSDLGAWRRIVQVDFVSPSDPTVVVGTNQGVKRITVSVEQNGIPAAELVALKTIGLPPLEACCFGDGSCEDLRIEACAANSGTSQGPDTKCSTTDCPAGPSVLLVVVDDTNPTGQELARQALIESWDGSAVLISASATQSEFDTAMSDVDVVLVSEEINSGDVGTKLTNATIGVVNGEYGLIDELGFAQDKINKNRQELEIIDNTHYVTSSFGTGTLVIFDSVQAVNLTSGNLAPDLHVLGEYHNIGSNYEPVLAFLEPGDDLYGGGVAAGRRVLLPWGATAFDINSLNANGAAILRRSLEWAAGMDTVCGDTTCDIGEECSCPVDCGVPAAYEDPGVTCDDGMDNDCDGQTDCDDINCLSDPSCLSVSLCGNSTCEPGEDCNSCSADCDSKTNGPSSGRYCCGNGIAESAEGDGSICDGNY